MSAPDGNEPEDEFREVADMLRAGLPELPTERPDERLWASITSELGLTAGVVAPPVEDREVPARERSAPVDLATRRRPPWRRPAVVLAAVAAVLLVGVPLALGTMVDRSDPARRVELSALGGFDGDGEAEVDGRAVTVDLRGAESPDGSFYELWLLDVDSGGEVRDLRSLGRIDVGADGSFTIPDEVDLTRFDTFDVSVEPDDGDPSHSGQSILRGELPSA